MAPKDKYTDPELREEVKEDIKQSDKGGAPGQWSARKAQMMAKEYKNRGGGYTTDKKDKDEGQKHLDKWTEDEWQTKEGSGHAKQDDGTQKRYLPKKAWEEMNEKERNETDKKKREGSKGGKQYVANTSRAKSARKSADAKEEAPGTGRETRSKSKKDDKTESRESDDKQSGEKRARGNKNDREEDANPAKKQKNKAGGTVGSKHDAADAPAQQGSRSRLPKKGTAAHWKAMPGWVDGKVVEVLKANKELEGGKHVKASKEDPRVVLKSNSSGKICVHKPDNVYFD